MTEQNKGTEPVPSVQKPYLATKTQLDAIVENFGGKLTPQNVYVTAKTGLTMRRADKNPPKGSLVVGTFGRDATGTKIRRAFNSLAQKSPNLIYIPE